MKTQPLHEAEGWLTPKAPFDFDQSLAFVRLFRPCAGEQLCDDGSLTKALRLDAQTVMFRVHSVGSVERPRLHFRLHSEAPLSPQTVEACARRIGRYLSIEDDLRDFYARAEQDPIFAAHARAQYGHHQVRFLTPIEIAIWAVLGQRTPMALARRVKDALVEKLGTRLTVDGVTHRAFPDLDTLGRLTPLQWVVLLKNARKARYAHAVVQAFTKLDERWLMTAPHEEAKAWLMDIDGIGDWSSAFILFRGLGRVDECPVTEPILRAAQASYGTEVTRAEAKSMLDAYGPMKGYWALYLRADDAAASQGLKRRRPQRETARLPTASAPPRP